MLPFLQFPLCLTALSLYAGQGSLHQFHMPHSKISLKPTASSGSLSLSLVTHGISLSVLMGRSFVFLGISCSSAAALPSGGCVILSMGKGGFPVRSLCGPGRTGHLWVGDWCFLHDLGCFSNLDVTWLLLETVLHILVSGVVTMNACQE